MGLFCPVTGLRVLSRPEWIHKRLSDTFKANFSIIGNSILYSLPEGKADLEGVQNSSALKQEVAKHVSNGTGPYIQIQDYSALNGSSQAARSSFINNANEDERLIALIFCNLSPALSIAVKIGNRFNTAGKHIHIARHYENAVKRALELCDQYNLEQDYVTLDKSIFFENFDFSLNPIEMISDDAWNIQTPEYSNRSSIINNCILHSISKGYFEVEHVPLISRMRNECQAALPEGSAIKYIVVDSSELKGVSRKARIQYMQSLKEWHQQFPFRMYIFYGLNTFMRTAALLARPLMPFKVRISQNFNHAFNIISEDELGEIAKKPTRQEKAEVSEPNKENIEKLLGFIGSINWEQKGIDSRFSVDERHPFSILFQSIKLIKEELDSVFSDYKKAAVALQNSNAQLQTALSELKHTQEKIVQQERLAAVGQLTAGIAHDFNNILTGILGFTELMQVSRKTPESMQSNLQTINALGERAAHLVHQLLDFSCKTIRQVKHFDLASFTKESVKFFERTIPENIRINLNIEPGDYLVEADPTQLQQVITNVAVNARDAMSTGGELGIGLSRIMCADNIHCMLCDQSIEGEWVQLKITDTGSGISTDLLPRIFEPFFTTKKIGEGTGLGLSQVAGIVAQHRGHIRVESQAGRRTAFTIYLPIVSASGEEALEPEPTQMRLGQGETILLVDDERTVLEATTAMLEHMGYRIVTAQNGEKAVAVFEEHKNKIALVLSDMIMPDMDGETLYQRLSAENPHLKMVMMSGYPLGEKGARLLKQGIVAWFQKPISLGQLSQILGKALTNEKGRWS